MKRVPPILALTTFLATLSLLVYSDMEVSDKMRDNVNRCHRTAYVDFLIEKFTSNQYISMSEYDHLVRIGAIENN